MFPSKITAFDPFYSESQRLHEAITGHDFTQEMPLFKINMIITASNHQDKEIKPPHRNHKNFKYRYKISFLWQTSAPLGQLFV